MRTVLTDMLRGRLLCALAAAVAIVLGAAAVRAQTAPPPGALSADKTRDNVVILLDASGSMREALPGAGQSKMEAAKAAILSVTGGVPANTNVGLLVFSGKGVSGEWVYPIGPVDQERLARAVAPIQPDGGTPLGAYIKKAGDALLERRRAQSGYGTFRLLVVTDGEAGDPALVEKYTPDVMSRGIVVDVIGVNMKSDHTLARKVHVYKRANEAATLNSALTQVFAELGSSGGSKDDQSSESFEIIRSLPEGFAPAVLAALSTPQDQPIGDEPSAANVPASGARPPVASRPSSPPSPAPQTSPSSSSGSSVAKWVPCCFITGIIFLFILGKAVRKAGGRR